MKIKKIVGFGDSWIYGDELLDPALRGPDDRARVHHIKNAPYREQHCFLGLLSKYYGVTYENFGIPGGSLQSAIWTFLWWLDHEPEPDHCLILVGLTNNDRFSYYNPNFFADPLDPPWRRFVHSNSIVYDDQSISEEFYQLGKLQIALTSCPELSHYNYRQAVLFFDGVCNRRGFPLLQFHTIAPLTPYRIPGLIWPDRNLYDFIFGQEENQDCRNPDGHPNEKGHLVIRDLLIPEIDRVILSM